MVPTVQSSGTTLPVRNLALDGIRGVAILAVVLFHATMTLGHHWAPVQIALKVTQLGWLGVEIFFALSGFLITGILLRSKFREPATYFRQFYQNRALRIFPLYFGVLLLLLTLPLLITSLDTEDYQRFVAMQAWFWLHAANIARAYFGPMNPSLEYGWFELTHFWTLAVEEHFYLIWPMLVYFLGPRALFATLLLIIVMSVSLRAGLVEGASPLEQALLATPTYLAGLAVGAMAALTINKCSRPTSERTSTSGALLSFVLLVIAAAAAVRQTPSNEMRAGLALLTAISTACIAMVVTLWPQGHIARILQARMLVTFGKYSYGIYVFHYLFGPLARKINISAWPGGYSIGAICYVILFITAPLLVAFASYHLWEVRWLRMKHAT